VTYQVQVPAFEGPFDLLLHLISKHEVDIFEISISQLTEDYLEVLTQMKELDLEVATEFLLVAATLLEIKSGRLLPGAVVDDDDAFALSDRDLLIARLLQYRAFKDSTDWFKHQLDENSGYIGRAVGPSEEFQHLCPDILARVSLDRFARIAVEVMTPRVEPTLDLSHLAPIGITIEEAIARVETALTSKEVITFREVAGDNRMEVVVHFLAMLELIKAGTVRVSQAELFGDIQIRKQEARP
jgi:segregation and condensation protein A